MNFNIPAVDVKASIDGRWFNWKYGIKCKIARSHNQAYTKGYLAILRAHKDEPDDTNIQDEMVELIVETILLDWKGLTNGDSKKPESIPYSTEVAVELLTDEKYAEFQGWVNITSEKMANFYEVEVAESVK